MISKILSKSHHLASTSRYSFNAFAAPNFNTPIAQKPGSGRVQHVTLVPGSGIGKTLTDSVRKIFDAAVCPIQWDTYEDFHTDNIMNAVCMNTLRRNEAVLVGMLPDVEKGKYMDSYRLYKELDCFANLTYAKSLPNVNLRHKDIDIVVIRENTEGEYSGVEHEVYPGVVESIKIITKQASDRIAEYAFEFAYISKRKKVTAVHKANIMKLCDGLFLDSCREVAKRYPHIQYDEIIIDNCCMQLVKNPWKFDVMVMPNLYGSIVSNTLAGLTGGPGMTAGANVGEKFTIFEQGTRHSGLEINGQVVANPTALILSSVMMLKHLGLPRFANQIEEALEKTFKEGKVKTADLGGKASCEEFTEEIVKNLLK